MDQGGLWGGFPCFLGFFLTRCFQTGERGEVKRDIQSSLRAFAFNWPCQFVVKTPVMNYYLHHI